MADISNLSNYLKDVADAIRAKKGTEDAIPAANFDTEIASITTSENLDDVLQEQTELINELEEILKTKSKSSSEPNVFMQEIEPEVKEGIWLQSDKTYQKIDVLESYTDTLEWQEPNVLSSEIYPNIRGAFTLQDTIYFVIQQSSTYYLYTYNVLTNLFTSVANLVGDTTTSLFMLPSETYESSNIYYICKKDNVYQLYYYSTYSKGNYSVYTFEEGFTITRCCMVDGDIYIFTSDKKSYKYSISNKELTNLGVAVPYDYFNSGNCFYYNDSIYFMGNNNSFNSMYSYKFDLTTNMYTKLTNIPYSPCIRAAMCLVGNKIYIFGDSNYAPRKFYIYDIDTDSYEQQTDLSYEVDTGYAIVYSDRIIIATSNDEHLQILSFPSTLSYETDTVVLIDGNTYSTQLLPYNTEIISGKILYKFSDVKYFNVEEQEITTIPTYYGDGTQWIKFKN